MFVDHLEAILGHTGTPVTIQDTVSIAAATNNENVLNSNTGAARYIRPPFDCVGRFVANASNDSVRAELVVNGHSLLEESDLRIASATQLLEDPRDELLDEFFCPMGGQLVVKVRNTHATLARSINYKLVLKPSHIKTFKKLVTQRGPISLVAGAKLSLLTGLRYERPRIDSILDSLISASAAGLLAEVFVDGQSIAPPLAVAASNRVPIYPEDTLLRSIEAPQGKLLEIIVTNPTGGTLTFNYRNLLKEQGHGD